MIKDGVTIGRLTIVSSSMEVYGNGSRKRRIYKTICQCGHSFELNDTTICNRRKRGTIFECRECLEKRRWPSLLDKKFGRWTVISETRHPSTGDRAWICLCECGVKKIHETSALTNKRKSSLSCGCYARKLHSKWANKTQYPPSHGFKSGTVSKDKKKIYCLRGRLLQRCYKPDLNSYPLYGGRGYTVCDLWRNGAEDFYKWCILNEWKPSDEIVIKKGRKEYSPESCYFVDRFSIASKVNSKNIQWKGKKQSITAWAQELGCPMGTLCNRLNKFRKKYGLDRAMDLSWIPDRPPSKNEKHLNDIVSLYRQGHTMIEISKKLGIGISPIYRLLHKSDIFIRKPVTRSSVEIVNKLPEIQQFLSYGLSLKEICKNLDLSLKKVTYHLKMAQNER